jgi:hypothetical protein
MGRTIPSFRIALKMEQSDWKLFRAFLDKSKRKKFDRMFDVPRLYISCCGAATNPILIQPIMMSMIFHHFKQLDRLVERVEKLSGDRYDSIAT